MPEFGEEVSAALVKQWKDDGKCILCGEAHGATNKKDEPQPTGWTRKAVKGVGGLYKQEKLKLYPNNQAPPDQSYTSQGHHCISLTCFLKGGKEDRILPLNHLLKTKAEYDPNNENNTMDLPRTQEDLLKSVQAGKALQIHPGGHDDLYYSGCFALLWGVYNALTQLCPKKEKEDDLKETLKKMIAEAEDETFADVASKRRVLNSGPCAAAEAWVKAQLGIAAVRYPKVRFKKRS